MTCVLCAARGRTRELDTGHVCAACHNGLRADLHAIVDAAAIAARIPDPRASRDTTGRRGVPGSRPPLDLAHIDPELVAVAAIPGDHSSDEPLLVLLESWVRVVREDRGLVPYGVATEGRAVTLAEVVGFLVEHLDWITSTPDFGIEDFAGHIRRGLAALRRLDPAIVRMAVWNIPCPTIRTEENA